MGEEAKKKPPKWFRVGCWTLVVMPVALCFLGTLGESSCWQKPPPAPASTTQAVVPRPPPKPTPLEASLAAMTPEEDAEREKLVVMAQKSAWLGEVDWELHQAVVGPGFNGLDFKMKEAVAWSVVLVGLRREGAKKGTFLGANYDLQLLDPKTNKRIGTYSTLWGKLTME